MSQQSIQVDLNQAQTVRCECGYPYLVQRSIIKRISGLTIGTGAKDHEMLIDLLFCEKCGKMADISKRQYPGLKAPGELDGEDAKVVKLSD